MHMVTKDTVLWMPYALGKKHFFQKIFDHELHHSNSKSFFIQRFEIKDRMNLRIFFLFVDPEIEVGGHETFCLK